ncbi:putative secreted protein [Parvularcula bermudensis HTCC2503]|uniref:Putative secreted protein n=1 Tax=Parvularcula bermudensis (strain ATCC BAA-594 / HTCC2503 / KCTC 12087) TaxID=314260 RepID=E0TF83_PARBH|nr:TraB/GumN family protein [Parvularcula bermudensis]ADM09001.1 putative secreted protein [Parvularcula bermudensis HTCC2503]
MLPFVLSLSASLVALQALPSLSEPSNTLEAATAGPSSIAIFQTGDEDTTIYMMGTVHILQPGLDWETPAFQRAWGSADAVYFEADVTSPEASQAASAIVMREGILTDGRTLSSFFSSAEKASLNDALDELGLTLSVFANIRPWLASIQIAQRALMNLGGDPTAGVDMMLIERAKAEGKERRYFETLPEQLEVLIGIPDEAWADSMIEGIDELQDTEHYFAELVGLWWSGDAEALGAVMTEAWEATPILKERLLDDRNIAWAETLSQLIEEEEGVFLVAVGAGHLGGEGSLQEVLEAEGYAVERVPN